jgi:dihydrofolate reductase
MISAFIIAAQSLDGYISPLSHTNSMSWTSGADKEFFKKKTKEAGVVIMGKTTFETIGKALPDRKTIVYSSTSIEVEDVETTTLSPQELFIKLEQEGYSEVAICGGSSIYSLFFNSGLVSKLYITLEPIIFGEGIPLFKDIEQSKLSLLSSTPLDQNALLLEYQITK